MGANFWDRVGLPLLIGLAIQIVVIALCFLSDRLWKCFIKQLTPLTAAKESAHDQPLPDGDAAARANALPDLEVGNGHGPAEGGQSLAEPETGLRIVDGGGELEHPQLANGFRTSGHLISSVTGDVANGALVRPVEMDVLHSQQEESVEGGWPSLPDLEMGTVNGGKGGEYKALPDLDVGMANGGGGEVSRQRPWGKWAAEIHDPKKATVSGWAPLTPRERPLWRRGGGRQGSVSFSTPEAAPAAPAAAPVKKRRNVALYFTPVRSFLCAELLFFESI